MPRYESYTESKISARAGAFGSPCGAGISMTMWSSRSATPSPVLPDTRSTSLGLHPISPAISSACLSGSALGRSILLSTGMMARSWSMAMYRLDSVCASMPCVASTSNTAPSHAASARDTSYVKSTWPGVSIMPSVYSVPSKVHGTRTACDLMVMPRSCSMSMRSRKRSRISRSGTMPLSCRMRSATVDLPWSMCAMMQKFRISD